MSPPAAGLGFKPRYFREAIAHPAADLWFEVHAENYMVDGGPRLAMLERLREARPLSLHGVGLSLAGAERPDGGQLRRLRRLVDRFEPYLVSEHLAWSSHAGRYFPDLLPFPRSNEALALVARNIDITQEAIGRPILIENPSLYVRMGGHDLSETAFLTELCRRTGCGLLVDVNNIFVSANNLGFEASDYLSQLPFEAIHEVHLAGHRVDPQLGPALLIDSHDAPVADAVWTLYGELIEQAGPRPTLIERDGNLPDFAELAAECARVNAIIERAGALVGV